MTWQVQEAKQKFSELVDKALSDGPRFDPLVRELDRERDLPRKVDLE